MLFWTGLNSALCCKSRTGNTEIGNKKDHISCCDFKFHAILRSSDNILHMSSFCTDDLPIDKYITYLQYPHINLGGVFKGNVATGNNAPPNYYTDSFMEYYSYGNSDGGRNQWNPDGTNDFSLINCTIRTACRVSQGCTDDWRQDSVVSTSVTGEYVSTIVYCLLNWSDERISSIFSSCSSRRVVREWC